VDLGTFKIDATEVTRGNYLAFVQAKNGNTSGQPAVCSASNTSYVPPTDWPPAIEHMEMPAVYVDWCDAVAYCTWAGGRLCGKIGGGTLVGGEPYDDPTQSQWMKACAGPSKTAFPYGPTYVEGRCNGAQPVAVASFPDCVGGYPGLYDMSGNSPEWEDGCTNNVCRKRGSHYGDAPQSNYLLLRCDENGYQPRETKDANISFRCCSSP
jgi:formylglycine-generating enzyme required for sulfatase activity